MGLTERQINAMSYRELQAECRKHGLPYSGKKVALQGRLREKLNGKGGNTRKTKASGSPPTAKAAKKQKRSAADDLTCPITLELPFDPVMAEDGRVYERAAIERYFATKRNARKVMSPITKEKIGKNLIACPQIRNHIETLVDDQVITGDLADKWSKTAKEKKHIEELLKKAESGDVDAMVDVAQNHDFGSEGFKRDEKKAFEWYEKARVAGSVIGAACIGETLLKIEDDYKKRMKGLMYLTSAAERGSDFAAYWLGMALANGHYGLPLDRAEGRKWLERAASDACTVMHLMDDDKEKIPDELRALEHRRDEEEDED